MQQYRQHEERRLNEARYRIPEHDIATIPIDRAMDLYLERQLQSGR